MKKKIVADCSADITAVKGVDYASIPLTVSTDERSFVDDENLDVDEMLDYLASYHGRSFTACPNSYQWMEAFGDADEVYAVSLTSGLSGTYAAGVTAAKEYMEKHPGTRVHVFDTLSAGPEVRMLCEKIAELIAEGYDFDEVVEKANNYLATTTVYLALESLHNFAQNGRVSKIVAAAAGALSIRILGTASPEGIIDVCDKCRGAKGTLRALQKKWAEDHYEGGRMCIAHCHAEPFAREVEAAVKEQFPNAKVDIYPTHGLCSYYAEKGGILLSYERASL